jgi:hypothetical protein
MIKNIKLGKMTYLMLTLSIWIDSTILLHSYITIHSHVSWEVSPNVGVERSCATNPYIF